MAMLVFSTNQRINIQPSVVHQFDFITSKWHFLVIDSLSKMQKPQRSQRVIQRRERRGIQYVRSNWCTTQPSI